MIEFVKPSRGTGMRMNQYAMWISGNGLPAESVAERPTSRKP